jgi:hypothetical protein
VVFKVKPMGRPKAENPLCIEIKAKIDKQTKIKLDEYCKKNNITVSEVIRECIKQVIEEKITEI